LAGVSNRINMDRVEWARRMRMNIIALVLISIIIPHCRLLAMAEGVPRFNIERTCRGAGSFTGADKEISYKGCLKDEADAHDQLTQKWTRFTPADRRDCIAQGATPMPSYVELLTCLEMSADVEAINTPGRGNPRGSARESSPQPTSPNKTPALPLGNGAPATKN
jgi:hypothetical protein